MGKVSRKILLSVGLGLLLSLLMTAQVGHFGITALYTLLLTGFIYGFGAVKDALWGVLAKTGHYTMSAILLRSFAGGVIVAIVAILAFGVVFYTGIIYGYIHMGKDLYHSLSGPRRGAGSYESIDLDIW